RQPRSGPAREGVGLVIADVAHRLVGAQRPLAPKCEDRAIGLQAMPVERGLPAFTPTYVPAFGKPQLGPLVAAVAHEREIVRVGDEPARKSKAVQEDAVLGCLVVESKAVVVVAYPRQSLGKEAPGAWGLAALLG